MNETPRQEREGLERRICELYAYVAELDKKSGMQATFATHMEIEREAGQTYTEIHRLQAEVDRLRMVEEAELKAVESKDATSGLVAGTVISIGLLVAAISIGSWLVAVAALAAGAWTVLNRGAHQP
ncbi:hypothetical protein ABT282_07870 [Streptomyces sp. NPDC000927]|uniref:hypothetical protein n=1 Tax=Streptomyces sp. NPDC000927 TaxID=3154371 RepID=UPI00331677C5